MRTVSDISSILRPALMSSTGGVVGLVDDLLNICRNHGLQLDWQSNCYRVRSGEGDWEELIDISISKSTFRAILARLAALCNERTPNSVSPYGGKGQLSSGADPQAVFRVDFTNTPTEQRLELTAATGSPTDPTRLSAQLEKVAGKKR